MENDVVVTTILDHCGMKSEDVLFIGRRSNWKVSRARHLIKYFLYTYQELSTPCIHRLMGERSSGFDHASTLHSIRTVRDQPALFMDDVIEIRVLLDESCSKKEIN